MRAALCGGSIEASNARERRAPMAQAGASLEAAARFICFLPSVSAKHQCILRLFDGETASGASKLAPSSVIAPYADLMARWKARRLPADAQLLAADAKSPGATDEPRP